MKGSVTAAEALISAPRVASSSGRMPILLPLDQVLVVVTDGGSKHSTTTRLSGLSLAGGQEFLKDSVG